MSIYKQIYERMCASSAVFLSVHDELTISILNSPLTHHTRNTVHLSMRSIPPCIPRQWGPLSVEEMSVSILQYLPVTIADMVVWAFYRILRTGSSRYQGNLPEGKYNPDWYPFSSRRVPPIDKGGFAVAVAEGKIVVHSCIADIVGKKIRFENKRGGAGAGVRKSDESEGLRLDVDVDVVVLCTGYKADWSWLQIPLPTPAPSPAPSSFPSSFLNLTPSLTSHFSSSSSSSATNLINSTSPYTFPSSHTSHHSHHSTPRTPDHDSACATLAKAGSVSPSSCAGGLYFVGYDPGPALIPLMAIREQAERVANCVQIALTD